MMITRHLIARLGYNKIMGKNKRTGEVIELKFSLDNVSDFFFYLLHKANCHCSALSSDVAENNGKERDNALNYTWMDMDIVSRIV